MTAEAPAGRWLELAVTCDGEAVEPVSELFASHGFNQGVAIEEAFTQDPDGDNFAVDPSQPVVVRTFLNATDVAPGKIEEIRQALWHLGRLRSISELRVTERAEEDWANAWKAHYSIHRVGRRVLVKAPWHDYDPAPDEIVVELDPGMAFGTGLHPSTQLSMIAIEDELEPGDRVLDVGTGSGVLATAAALLGASVVDGVDIEPVAVRSARENAERNGVGEIIRIEQGSVGDGEPFQGDYDLVVGNIDVKEAAVRDPFNEVGLTLIRREEHEDWVSLVLRKPAL